MFGAPRVWPCLGGPRLLGTMGILTLMLCSCSGQLGSLPWDLSDVSSREHQGGEIHEAFLLDLPDPRTPLARVTFSLCPGAGLVFIHLESSHYSLPCSPAKMEVADPGYQWEQDRADPKLFPVTKEGHLLFQHFQAGDSGRYSCTIFYMEGGVPASQTFHYSILGYHVLGGLDTVLLFHSTVCEDEWTRRFLRGLQGKLRHLEIKQHCKFQLASAFCFPSLSNRSDEFIVQVQLEVSLFGPHWDEHCNSQDTERLTDCYHKTVQHNLGQVQLALNRFFKEHKSFHITGAGIPSINFTNEFVGVLKTKQCNGGYGQTKQLLRCLDCCIVCPPGMFSTPKNGQCSPCPVGTYSLIYGVAFCTPCKDGMITREPGASSMTDCVKSERTEHAVSIMHKMPSLILFFLAALLTTNFIVILTSCYWFYREYQVSFQRTSKVMGSPTRMETVISFFRIPWQSPQAGPTAGPAGDTSHLNTSTPRRGDEEHSLGTPPLVATPSLADMTDETMPVLTQGDRTRTF